MKSIDKRKHERPEIFLVAEFRPRNKNVVFVTGVTSNISSYGFNLESQDAAIDPGEILEITFKHPHNSLSCSFLGKVVWSRQAWYKYMMGITFFEIDEENKQKRSVIIAASTQKNVEYAVQEEDTANGPEPEQAENPAIRSGNGKIDDLIISMSDRYYEDVSLEEAEHEKTLSIENKESLEGNAGYIEETHPLTAGEEFEIPTEQPHDFQAEGISQLNKEKRSPWLNLVIPGFVVGVLAIFLAVPDEDFHKESGNVIPSHTESASVKEFNDKQNLIPAGDIQDIDVTVNAVLKSGELQTVLPAPYNDSGYIYDPERAAGSGKAAKTKTFSHTVVPEPPVKTNDKEISISESEEKKEKLAGTGLPGYIKKTPAAEITETVIEPDAEQSVRREHVNEIEQTAGTNEVTETAAAEESVNTSITKSRKIIWSVENQPNKKIEPVTDAKEAVKTEVSEPLEKPAATEVEVINKTIKKSLPVRGEEKPSTASVKEDSVTPQEFPSEVKRERSGEEGRIAAADGFSKTELSETQELSVKTAFDVMSEKEIISESNAGVEKSPKMETAVVIREPFKAEPSASKEKREKTGLAAERDKGVDNRLAEADEEARGSELLKNKEEQSKVVRSNRSRIPKISLVVTGKAPKKP